MKRMITIILIAVMFLLQVPVFASEVSEKVLFDITSMGIMQGDENGELRLDESVTRAEFATVMTKLMMFQDSAGSIGGDLSFLDVNREDWFYNYVAFMCAIDLMSGYSQTEFGPNDSVTFQQAVKTVVIALGYGVVANQGGGYPQGHLSVAANIGLTKNIAAAEKFTRGNLAILLYNALDINQMSLTDHKNEIYEVEKGNTFRNLHLENGLESLYKIRGIVTANVRTWLNAPNATLKSDEVEIEDLKYKTGTTKAADYLGQEIEFYVRENTDGDKVIVSAQPTKINTVTEIPFHRISTADLNSVQYIDDGRLDKIELNPLATVIRGGRRILFPKPEDLEVKRGSITLIDHDGDERADVVFVNDFTNLRVKEVKGNTIEFAPGQSFNGSRFLYIDTDDKTVQYDLVHGDGEKIRVDEILTDDILSIQTDADRQYYKIIVTSKVIEGELTELADDWATIGGTEYPLYDKKDISEPLGSYIIAYLDHQGYIAGIGEDSSTVAYGHVVGVESKNTMNTNIQVKMLVSADLVFEYKKNEKNLDDKNTIPIVKCQNSEVKVFEVANSINVNGTRYKSNGANQMTAIKEGLYSFTTDSSGKLTKLISAELAGGGTEMSYNVYDKTFSGGSSRIPIAIDDLTQVICVPKNSVQSDEDYLVPLEISNRVSGMTFEVRGYDLSISTKKVNIIVFADTMKAMDIQPINTDTASIGMVTASAKVLDDENEEITRITVLSKEGSQSYDVKTKAGENDVIDTLKAGDLIYYVLGLSNTFDNAKLVYSFQGGLGSFIKYGGLPNQQVSGYIVDIEYDEVDVTKGNLLTRVKVSTKDGDTRFALQQRNTPVIFLYDSQKKTVSIGGINDLMPSQGNSSAGLLYALIPYGNDVKACVIYR